MEDPLLLLQLFLLHNSRISYNFSIFGALYQKNYTFR